MSKRQDTAPQKPQASTAGTLLYLLFGPLVWAGQFTVVYGSHTLVCALGGTPKTVDWIVLAATSTAVFLLAGFIARPPARAFGAPSNARHGQGLKSMAHVLAVLSLIAVLWAGATVVFVASCIQGR